MTQRKKDAVLERIECAALAVFVQKGYLAARVSDISARAGVSVGNIYRYYKNKDEIFYALLPQGFPDQLLSVIADKVGACRSGDPDAIGAMAESFIVFLLQNRERIAILFTGTRGTAYECFEDSFAGTLLSIVQRIYEKEVSAYISRYGGDAVLREIYRNLIRMFGRILRLDCSQEEAERQLRQLNLYHYHGITKLLNII